MSPKPELTTEPVYQKIQQYYNQNGAKINIKSLFEQDPSRFDKFRWVGCKLEENKTSEEPSHSKFSFSIWYFFLKSGILCEKGMSGCIARDCSPIYHCFSNVSFKSQLFDLQTLWKVN